MAKKWSRGDASVEAGESVVGKSRDKVQSLLDDQPSHTDTFYRDEPAPEPVKIKVSVAEDTETVSFQEEAPRKDPEPAPPARPEKVSAVRNSVLPGFGSPGFKLLQIVLGGVLLGIGLFFHFTDTDAEGASFMSIAFLVVAFLLLSYEVIWEGVRKLFRARFLDSDVLVTIGTIGGIFVGQFPEATAAMFLYVLAGFFTSLNASHSDALFGAMDDFEVDSVFVARDGGFTSVPPEEIRAGETILVRENELVPFDGTVLAGTATLDIAMLTGETAPKSVFTGDRVSAGSIVTSDELRLLTTATYAKSTAQKVLDFLYDDSAEESREGEFVRKFSKAFGIVVLLLGLALGIIPSLLTGNWTEWMRIAFTFFMVAANGELMLQVPLIFENGLGTAFYNGVCVRGDGPLEQLAHAEKVVFNKTGTLTKGEPDVIDMIPEEGYHASQLMEAAAKAEALSDHRIARCIAKAYGKAIDTSELVNFTETPGSGVCVYANGHRIVAGNARCMLEEGIDVRESHQAGNKLHVAVDRKYLGCIVTSDTVRRDSEETVKGLHDLGLNGVTMLTGGARGASKLIAEELGVDEFGAELAPEDKVAALQTFAKNLSKDGTLVFVGDGLKDAELLKLADAGVALGALRSNKVFDLADVVVVPECPSRVAKTIRTARQTFRAARTNTVITLALKAIVMVLAVVGITGLWSAALVTFISAVYTGIACRRIRAGWAKGDPEE